MFMYVKAFGNAFMKNEIVCQEKGNAISSIEMANSKTFRKIEPKKMEKNFSVVKGFRVSLQFVFGLKIKFSKVVL